MNLEQIANRLFCRGQRWSLHHSTGPVIQSKLGYPPFFSGRQYNVIFGDQNELRSFSDIWEGGTFTGISEISTRLKREGYGGTSVYIPLEGKAIRADLKRICDEAKRV